jgi:hypothetical protein
MTAPDTQLNKYDPKLGEGRWEEMKQAWHEKIALNIKKVQSL